MGDIPKVALANSTCAATIHLLGFGTAAFPFTASENTKEAVLSAIKLGYRHFDAAAIYNSEQPLGDAVAEALRDGVIKSRSELFITSKLWCKDEHPHRVLPALQKTLKNLGMEYFDLYLIHFPVSLKRTESNVLPFDKGDLLPMDFKGVWEAMEDCLKLGFTKHIGVSNFSIEKLQNLLSTAEIPPAVNQSLRKTKNFPWRPDLFEDSIRAAGLSGLETATKLYISNLDHGVTNEDIRELFADFGKLKRYAVHYDKNGHPSGSAEVVYTRRSDAFAALKRYNNVQLDGKPMKIEVIGSESESKLPVSARLNVSGGVNGRRRAVVVTPGMARAGGSVAVNHGSGQRSRGGLRNGGHGGLRNGGRGRGRGRGQGQGQGRGIGKKQPIEKSADQLDKELESYHTEAMHIS